MTSTEASEWLKKNAFSSLLANDSIIVHYNTEDFVIDFGGEEVHVCAEEFTQRMSKYDFIRDEYCCL